MEKYINRIQKLSEDCRVAHIKGNSRISEIRNGINSQIIGLQTGNADIARMEKQIEDLLIETDNAILSIRDEYLEELEKFYTLDGKNVTDDIKLLDGKFSLTQEQLNKLSEKYRLNFSMHSAVEQYGKEHGLSVKPIQEQQTRVDLINSFITLIAPIYKNAPSSLYNDDNTVMTLFEHRKKQILDLIWD